MKLSPIFSDGMVLQRDTINSIKGSGTAGNRIVMKCKDVCVEGTVDGEGAFSLELPAFGAEENVDFSFAEIAADGAVIDTAEIKEAAFGDVFLLSGQSNMELPVVRTLDVTEEVVKASVYPLVREFAVPMEYDFTGPRTELSGGEWKSACGEKLLQFGATGFFMAKALYDKYQVPIGLIRSAIGGTPIQAWCSEKTIRELGDCVAELEQCRKAGYIERIQKEELQEQADWNAQAGQFSETPLGSKGELVVPGMWHDTELSGFHGSLILEKEFFLNSVSEGTARAYIGTIVDADKIYINGHLIGETTYKYPPRKYDFPAEYLKEGNNHIRIEMFVYRETGGFIPGKPYYVRSGAEICSLEGVWNYHIVKTMPVLKDLTFFQYKATGLYNGMLSPLAGTKVRAMAFYQGESNTDAPEGYGEYFNRAIADWRTLLGNPSLPVAFVQLACFADSKLPCTGTKWAVLRNEQLKALQNPDTAMVVTTDIGEYNDLHPQNKLELGNRLALAMEKLVYGEDVVYSGPIFAGAEVEGNICRMQFTHTGSGLMAKGTLGEVYGVELAGADGIFFQAKAQLAGVMVEAFCKEVERPVYCRYAWNDCPQEANLYNKEGLPASAFANF